MIPSKQKIRCSLSLRVNFARTSTASSFLPAYNRPFLYHLPTSFPFRIWLCACNLFFTGRLTTRHFPKPG
jgi:hypothetical protein